MPDVVVPLAAVYRYQGSLNYFFQLRYLCCHLILKAIYRVAVEFH